MADLMTNFTWISYAHSLISYDEKEITEEDVIHTSDSFHYRQKSWSIAKGYIKYLHIRIVNRLYDDCSSQGLTSLAINKSQISEGKFG